MKIPLQCRHWRSLRRIFILKGRNDLSPKKMFCSLELHGLFCLYSDSLCYAQKLYSAMWHHIPTTKVSISLLSHAKPLLTSRLYSFGFGFPTNSVSVLDRSFNMQYLPWFQSGYVTMCNSLWKTGILNNGMRYFMHWKKFRERRRR